MLFENQIPATVGVPLAGEGRGRRQMNMGKQDTGGDHDVWQLTRPTGAELSKDGLFPTIWRRRWIVVLAMIASLAAAAIYLTQVTPTYASTSRLYVEQTGPKIITDSEGVMTCLLYTSPSPRDRS